MNCWQARGTPCLSLVLLCIAEAAGASVVPGTVSGRADKDEWSVSVKIALDSDGQATGTFNITRYLRPFRATRCDYDRFTNMTIVVNRATFDAQGVCRGENEAGPFEFVASNRVVIFDNGPGVDTIDVNYLGASGVAVPGGPITGGNLQVSVDRAQSVADLQQIALRRLRGASTTPIEVHLDHGFPRGVIASVPVDGTEPVTRAANFIRAFKDVYRINSTDLALGVRRVLTDGRAGPGALVAFYETYKGLPVHGGDLIVWLKGNIVYGTVGRLLTSGVRLETTPTISAQQAEASARRYAGGANFTVLGQTKLMVFAPSLAGLLTPASAEPHLAWRVGLGGQVQQLFVDARTGEVLFREVLSQTDYELDLNSAENATSAQESLCYWQTNVDKTAGDEDALEDEFTADDEAVHAWTHAEQTYDFYRNTLNRDSYDDDGNEFEIYIHAKILDANGNVAPNARFIPCDIGPFTDELFEFSDGFPVRDVVTHEITHGVVAYGSELGRSNLPGALNESFSDIMAAVDDGNWLQGEDLPAGPSRSLSDPPSLHPNDPDPDRWSQRKTDAADKGRVHANAGITNKAAFLLAEGGVHPATFVSVTGIGKDAMGYLFYLAALGVPSDADPFDARTTVHIAALMAGYPSWAINSIKNAFAAVEVSFPTDDVDGDFVPDVLDNCKVVPNTGQDDNDGDGIGNACDNDDDGDGVPEGPNPGPQLGFDNCPGVFNPGQTDANHNGIGAACDPAEDGDIDNDQVPDAKDNCPLDANANQADVDADGFGDACDPDGDGDGVSNDDDNCPGTPNANQADTDGDFLGNACDQCPNDKDDFPAFGYFKDPVTGKTTIKTVVPDSDGDGIPDACDGGIGRAAIQFDGQEFRPANGLRPDGATRAVTIAGHAGDTLSIPVPLCLGDCAVAPASEKCVAFEFSSLRSDLHAAISDDSGRGVAKLPRRRADRALRFQPRGGRTYYLNFFLTPDFGSSEEFTLVERACTVGDRSTGPRGGPIPPPPMRR